MIRVKLKRVVSNNVQRFFSGGNSYYEKFADGSVKCIDEEIPFEPPKGWSWERFGNLVFNRDSERIPLSVSERNGLAKKYDYYGASGVIDKVDRPLFRKPLLLIGEDGANLINRSTPIAFIAKGEYWVNNHAHVIDCRDLLELEYLCLYINAIPLTPYVTGTAQPKMNQEKMNSILVAVPPIAEQVRIVKNYSEIEPIISRFSLAQRRMDKLNDEFNERLRKSILQEAIQGKLVPQDPNDEPVSELLNCIQAEKQKLLKEGKLKKKDIVDFAIYRGEDNKYYENVGNIVLDISDEIPFVIPDSWQWVRLGYLFAHNTGKALNKADTGGVLKKYLTTSNVYWNRFDFNEVREMFFADSEVDKCTVRKGDLLVCEGGDIGRAAIWPFEYEICIQNHIHRLRAYYPVSTEFYYYVFELYKGIGHIGGKGIGIQGLSSGALHNLVFPLPPVQEQERIVLKIKEMSRFL